MNKNLSEELKEAMRNHLSTTGEIKDVSTDWPETVKNEFSEEENFIEMHMKAARLYHRRTGKTLGTSM